MRVTVSPAGTVTSLYDYRLLSCWREGLHTVVNALAAVRHAQAHAGSFCTRAWGVCRILGSYFPYTEIDRSNSAGRARGEGARARSSIR